MSEVDAVFQNLQFAWYYLLVLFLNIGPVQLFFDVYQALASLLYPAVPR